MRNRRELNASLKGATLGDADAETDDTLKWIKRNRKKQKELAKKRQEELESMDKMFQEEYTERTLLFMSVDQVNHERSQATWPDLKYLMTLGTLRTVKLGF